MTEDVATKEKKQKVDKLSKLLKSNMYSANAIVERKRDIISWSPALDDILGGGVESGSFVIMVGNPKIGKTTTCLHFAKKAQQMGYDIVFLNIEGRLSKRDLTGAYGLDIDKLLVVESTPESPLSGNDYIFIAEGLFKTRTKTVIIFDSFSQLIDEGNISNDIREFSRDSMPLLLSKFCKRIMPHLSITNNICIGITHQVANTSGYGSSTSETSGRKIQYAMNFKLKAVSQAPWFEGKEKDCVGQIVEWKCENSAIGVKGKTNTSYIRYNVGIDEEYELIPVAESLAVIQNAGSWYVLHDGTKIQGLEGTVKYLREHPEKFQEIKQEVSSILHDGSGPAGEPVETED